MLFGWASFILGWVSMPVLAQHALEQRGFDLSISIRLRLLTMLPCTCGAILGWSIIESPVPCVIFTLACACMGCLLACDLREHILPTGFVAAMLALAAIFRVWESGMAGCVFLGLVAACIAALLFGVNFLHMRFRSHDLIGAGDIRMIVPLMLFTGIQGSIAGLFAASIVMGSITLILLASKRVSRDVCVPLAPGLAAWLLFGTLIPLA